MKFIYCLLLSLCPYISFAQEPNVTPIASIHSTAPNILFSQVLNHPANTASLYDFKSRLLIVDFWAGYCGGCLHKFPLLDSLQQQHPQDLKVLLISSSAKDKLVNTKALFKRIKAQHPTFKGLPVVLGDTLANQYFEHQSIPHYVWLDQDFKIIAITGTDDITAEKISAYLGGAPLQFGQKDQMDNFDLEKPLFINDNGGEGQEIISRSTLTGFIPALASRSYISVDKNRMVTKMVFTNQPVVRLLMTAYTFYERPERLRYQPRDTGLQILNRSDEWLTANSYSYELITPPLSQADALTAMQQDLRRLLQVYATVDTVMSSCYILTRTAGKPGTFNASAGNGESSIQMDEKGLWHFKNVSIEQIAEFLDNKLDLHVLAEVSKDYRFDIDLSDERNGEKINNLLLRYGFELRPARRPLPVFSIHKLQN